MIVDIIGGILIAVGALGAIFFGIARLIHAAYRNEALRMTFNTAVQLADFTKPSPPLWLLWVSLAAIASGLLAIVLRL